MKRNGSPDPVFEMDEERNYLETTIYIRKGFEYKRMSESMSESMSELDKKRMTLILDYLKLNSEITSTSAAKIMGVQPKTAARLLGKAEKAGILMSNGKTKNKVYLLKAKE